MGGMSSGPVGRAPMPTSRWRKPHAKLPRHCQNTGTAGGRVARIQATHGTAGSDVAGFAPTGSDRLPFVINKPDENGQLHARRASRT